MRRIFSTPDTIDVVWLVYSYISIKYKKWTHLDKKYAFVKIIRVRK